jgi:dihydrolipoamide dehydrogenase
MEPSKGVVTVEEEKSTCCLGGDGTSPYTTGLGLEALGIQLDSDGLKWTNISSTKVPSIYAIGDCIDGPMLAPKAEEEGIAASDHGWVCGSTSITMLFRYVERSLWV